MQLYVSFLENKDDYIKKIASFKPSDELVLFTSEKDASISLDLFNELQSAKCKVSITQLPEYARAHIQEYIAYLIGQLSAQKELTLLGDMRPCEFLTDFVNNKADTPKRARKANTNKQISVSNDKPEKPALKDEFMNPPATEPAVQEKKTRKPKTKKEDKETPAPASTTKSEPSDDDFDKVFDELTGLVLSLNTDDFEISAPNVYNIINAVHDMDNEKITFQAAIKRNFSSFLSSKVFTAIKPKKREIVALVRKLPNEVIEN